MTCPQCRSEKTSVKRTANAGDRISRYRNCLACGGCWWSDEEARKGTFVHAPVRNVTHAIGAGNGPPITETPPSARTNGTGGVGGAPPSGIDPSPISPDPSRQSDQDLPRASGAWSVWDWRRKYGIAWCAKYGGTAIGGDGDADGKLGDLLAGLPLADRLAAQARAAEMFAEFLAEGGEPAKARHRWSWFVGRFEALRVPMAKPTSAPGPGYREIA